MGVRQRENVRGVGLGLGYKVVDEGKGVRSVYEELGVWSSDCVPLSFCACLIHSQAEVNIIAGACLSMGMRFAGTAHKEAFDTLVREWGRRGVFGEGGEKVFSEGGGRRCLVREEGGCVW